MDINNYSYAPHILDEDTTAARFENDDVCITIDRDREYSNIIFWVSAWSYDGQLDYSEKYEDEKTARAAFDYIVGAYGTTPPDGDITDEVNKHLAKIA